MHSFRNRCLRACAHRVLLCFLPCISFCATSWLRSSCDTRILSSLNTLSCKGNSAAMIVIPLVLSLVARDLARSNPSIPRVQCAPRKQDGGFWNTTQSFRRYLGYYLQQKKCWQYFFSPSTIIRIYNVISMQLLNASIRSKLQ